MQIYSHPLVHGNYLKYR